MGLFDALKTVAGSMMGQQKKEPVKEPSILDTLASLASAASGNNAQQSSGGGLLESIQNIQNTANTISAVKNILDGKIDLKSISTLLMTYFSSQGTAKKDAQTQSKSIADSIASAVNLSSVSSITDLVGKLNASDKAGTTDMATILTSAVTQLIAKK